MTPPLPSFMPFPFLQVACSRVYFLSAMFARLLPLRSRGRKEVFIPIPLVTFLRLRTLSLLIQAFWHQERK